MTDSGVPSATIEGCRLTHATLDEQIASLTDTDCRAPSALPGWSRAHVLTHMARNADSVLRRLDGAMRDVIADQYAGGEAGRAEEIESGATRSVAELIEDVRVSSAAVDAAFAAMPAEAWHRLGRGVSGKEHPVSALPFQRWREVECHLVDLDIGYESSGWPAELVELWLPHVTQDLWKRTDPHALLAWGLNRGPAPELRPWG